MTLDSESLSWQRREKKRRQYQLKNLPYHLDSAVVDDELSKEEQSRGVGRALKRIQEGVQGNFDHISAEMTRFANLYNEGEADSAYMRDLLDPHDHEPGMAQDPARSEEYEADLWYQSYHFNAPSEDAIVSQYLEAVPIRFDDNVYCDALSIEVTDIDTSVDQIYTAGVYNGDNHGGLAGSLLADLGTLPVVEGQMMWDADLNLKRGQWYWLVVTYNDNIGSGHALHSGWDSSGSGGNGVDSYSNHWWPFPMLTNNSSNLTGYGIDALSYASGDPLPQQVYVVDLYEVVESLVIELRVP